MNLKKLLLYSILYSAFPVLAQDVLWEKSLGGKHAEFLYDAQPTADYGFILAGSSLSDKSGDKEVSNLGDLDYWIWKMKEDGSLDWQKSYGGNGSDQLISLKLTKDGGFLLGGSSTSDSKIVGEKENLKKENCFGNEDFWILKLNAKGDEEWQKTLGGLAQDYLVQVILTKDNGYLLAGSSASGLNGNKETIGYGALDYWLIKIDSKGKVEWQQSYGGTFNDELKSVIETYDGGFLIGGYSNSPFSGTKLEGSKGGNDFWVIKTDKDGNEEWQKVIGGRYDDQLSTVLQDKEHNYIIAGSTNDKDNGKNKDMLVLKLDEKGEIIWKENYDFSDRDILSTIIKSNDDTYVIGGYIEKKSKTGEKNNNYILFKINHKGEKLWDNELKSQANDILRKVSETRDGGYLLSGTRKKKGSSDFLIIKLKDKQKPPTEKINVEAFPNPAQSFTNVIINYEYSYGTATLYDLNGRMIKSEKIDGSRTIPIDLSGLPQGIYIIDIDTNIQKDGIKIMKN
jgi:hypothetical protein